MAVITPTVTLDQEINPWEAQSARFEFAARKLNLDEQRKSLSASDDDLARERRVDILGVYHSDSTCRLDLITLLR